MNLKIAIVGLGLIGGSLAKAIKERTANTVIGFDLDEKSLTSARDDGSIDYIGSNRLLKEADILFLCLYPQAIIDFAQTHFSLLRHGCIVVDFCGVKQYICENLSAQAIQHHLIFIGGHPMAGREFSGYSHSSSNLFEHSSMILTPTNDSTPEALQQMKKLFSTLGFAQVVLTTPENHDRMIAFTSQLAHVLSSAYIKSPEALSQQGYSAGSYKDLTRVAKLNETMWTELFLKNRMPLLQEIDTFITHLTEYRNAIYLNDATLLCDLLREGRERKEQIG